MRTDYDAEDLRLFALIHAAGSLSAAERRYGVPKSTLSRSLARLEKTAGVALFDRLSCGLRPTPLANDLLLRGQMVEDAITGADQILRSAGDEPSGKLVIAASATSCQFLLSKALGQFINLYPSVDVQLEVTSAAPDPQAEGIDLSIQVGLPENQSLIARKVLAGPTGLYAAPSVELNTWSAVKNHGRIVISSRDAPKDWVANWVLQKDGKEVLLDDPPIASVGDPSVAIDLISASIGVTMLPLFFAAHLVEAGIVRRALPGWYGPTFELFAVLPPGRRRVAGVRKFIDLLSGIANEKLHYASQVQEGL